MQTQTTTLFGKTDVAVKFEDGQPGAEPRLGTLTVRQFKVAEWPQLMAHYDDEPGLVALSISKPREFLNSLTPESYEDVQDAMREVNAKGFFSFAGRRIEAGNSAIAGRIRAGIPPEKVAAMMKAAAISSGPSPTLPPPAR